MSAQNNNLRPALDAAVDAYTSALLDLWSGHDSYDPIFSPAYGHWAGDDRAGIYCYEDMFTISLPDMAYCVDNAVPYHAYSKWLDYCVEAAEFGFDTPNLRSFLHGCPRIPQDTLDRLRKEKQRLADMIELVKNSPETKF